MGNFNSCFCSSCPSSRSAELLDPHGNLQRVGIPVPVAELMVEYPGHLVCSLDGVHQTGRFTALRADDELMAGKAYVAVPCNRTKINCRATRDELAAVELAFKGRHGRERGREIFKDAGDGVKVKDGEMSDHHQQQQQQQQRSSCYRSRGQWSPALEPIFEN